MSSITSTISSILNAYYGIGSTNSSTSDKSTSSTSSATSSSSTSYTGTLVGKYLESVTSDTANAKTIFEKLSVDVGSDGKTITKAQLDSFIKDAKNGDVKVSDKELAGLTELQKNWTKIADGGDKITYASVRTAGFKDTLTEMAPDKKAATGIAQDFIDSTADAYGKVVKAALAGISTDTNNSTSNASSGLTKLLNSLLKGTTDENDEANAELISTLTNLIAATNSTTTTEYEA